MYRRLILLPIFALGLLLAIPLTQVAFEQEAQAEIFEVWAQGQGGFTDGDGSDVFAGSGMPFYGFAAGIEVFMIDAFIDIRLEDALDGGTWNQLGLAFDINIEDVNDTPISLYIAFRAAYVYAQFTEEARTVYLESTPSLADPPNKGLNFSTVVGIDVKITGPLYLGVSMDVGYHVLLPDAAAGINFHPLGYLKFRYSLF